MDIGQPGKLGEGGMSTVVAAKDATNAIGPGSPVSARNFYGKPAITEAERVELDEAREVEGLADEIAMLRVELRKALDKRPVDIKLMARGVEMLVKAVAAQYRLSPKAKKELADNIAAVLNGLGDQLLPADR